ncbi:MAG: hypothetical protein WA960_19315 [Tunicatimonas sp.]
MNYGVILMVLIAWIGGIDDIATVNRLKTRAKTALEQKDYAQAASYYTKLVDSLRVDDEALRLNLAHTLLLSGDTAQSQLRYSQLTSSQSTAIKSVAYQQLGVLASGQKKYPEALATFKESLKADPSNEESRYNYELVKKLLEQQQEQEQQEQEDQQQDDQQKEPPEDQEKQEQEGEQQKEKGEQGEDQEGEPQDQQSGEQEPEDAEEQEAQEGKQSEGEKDQEQSSSPVSDKLKEMNISEEKAQMILEAMRNNEMQYIQQNRRKPQKPRDRTKPDW